MALVSFKRLTPTEKNEVGSPSNPPQLWRKPPLSAFPMKTIVPSESQFCRVPPKECIGFRVGWADTLFSSCFPDLYRRPSSRLRTAQTKTGRVALGNGLLIPHSCLVGRDSSNQPSSTFILLNSVRGRRQELSRLAHRTFGTGDSETLTSLIFLKAQRTFNW